MPAYGIKFARQVADALQFFSPAEQDEVERLFGIIQMDPVPDPATKTVLVVPPAVFTVYVTDQFWIVYHVVAGDVIVVNLGRATTPPVPW